MTASFEQRQSAIVDLIYDAVLDASLWSRVLEDLSDFTGSVGGLIHGYAIDEQIYTFHDLGRIDPECKRRHELFHVTNPWMRSNAFPAARLVRSDEIVPLETLKRSAFYADVLQPQNIAHCMTVILAQREGLKVSINLERSEAIGAYNDNDIAMLGCFLPHLRRACNLRLRMLDYKYALQAERDALDALTAGIVTFDKAGHILFANAAARTLPDGFQVKLDVGAEISVGSSSLTRALRKLIGETAKGGAGGSLRMANEPNGEISISIMPVRGKALDYSARHTAKKPAVAAIISDVAAARDTASLLFAAKHDLTPAELRVVSALSRGNRMSVTAEVLGISLNTLKTHTKHIYAKTGVQSQAELMSAMVRLAPLLDH